MDARTFLVASGGALQLFVGLFILQAEGTPRLRASLAGLFFLNAVGVLAGIGDPAFGSLPSMISHAADWTTGLFLLDVGVLLSGSRFERFSKFTGSAAVAGLIVFPLIVAWTGPPGGWAYYLADATTMCGFLAAYLGTSQSLRGRLSSRSAFALVLAFAPRAIEYAGIILVNLNATLATPLAIWRIPFVLAVAAIAIWQLASRRQQEVSAFVLSASLAAITVLTPGGVRLSFALNLFTLILSRSAFVLVALALGQATDPLRIPPKALATRTAVTLASLALGIGIGAVFGGGQEPIFPALFAVGLGIVGFAVADSFLESPAVRHALPLGLTQGDRVLLALRGVATQPGRDASPSAGTPGLSAATGIPGKHLPEVVRRLNERGPEPLIAVDLGPVRGIRRRNIPRYSLTAAGAIEAEVLAARTGSTQGSPPQS